MDGGARLEVLRSYIRAVKFNHSHPLVLMTTLPPAAPVPPGQYIRATILAAVLALLLAVALKFTTLSPGLRTGMSFATLIIAQAVLIQRTAGRNGSSSYWAMVLLLALAGAAGTGLVAEL